MGAAAVAILSGLAGAAIGAVAGFYFRAAEFRRDRRMDIYADFVAAFLTVGHEGAGALSLWTQYGESLYGEHRKLLGEIWPGAALQNFEHQTARLRMVGSREACTSAELLEDFVNQNVRNVPPMRLNEVDKWGAFAKVGPSGVDGETVRLARDFADMVRADLSANKVRRSASA